MRFWHRPTVLWNGGKFRPDIFRGLPKIRVLKLSKLFFNSVSARIPANADTIYVKAGQLLNRISGELTNIAPITFENERVVKF